MGKANASQFCGPIYKAKNRVTVRLRSHCGDFNYWGIMNFFNVILEYTFPVGNVLGGKEV